MSNNKLLSKFSSRIGKLLDDDDEFNTTIFVGGGKKSSSSEIKTFKAHSIILKVNTSYFENILNNNDTCTRKFYLENISPSVFEVILK